MPILTFDDVPVRANGDRVTADWWNDLREAGVNNTGSGVGGINYIFNLGMEVDTTGYTGYGNTSAASSPDNFGGSSSANFTVTRNTTTPLRGAADLKLSKAGTTNLQGKGIYYQLRRNQGDLYIDTTDQGRVFRISMDFNCTHASYVSGDIRCYIVASNDNFVADFQIIEPSRRDIPNEKGQFITEFQTLVGVAYYRLCFHQATTVTTDYDLYFDNIQCGPREIARGSVVTDPVAYTPSNTDGFGTITSVDLKWSRVGSYMLIYGGFTSGTVTGSTARLELPAGYTIGGTTSARFYAGEMIRAGGTRVTVMGVQGRTYLTFGSGASSQGDVLGSSLVSSTEALKITSVLIPISGWSSNANISSDFGGRIILASYYVSSNNAPGANNQINFDTKIQDTAASVTTGSGWKFTANESGFFDVLVNTNLTTATTSNMSLYKNGSLLCGLYFQGTSGINSGSAKVYLNAGDYIDVRGDGASTYQGTANQNSRIQISKIQSPQTLMGGEVVKASYTLNGSTANSVFADNSPEVIDYNLKVVDSHNAVTTGASWKFTAPYTGAYRVNARLYWANVTNLSGTEMYVRKNGSNIYILDSKVGAITIAGTATVELLAGEYIDFTGLQDDSAAGTRSINTGSTGVAYVMIEKVN